SHKLFCLTKSKDSFRTNYFTSILCIFFASGQWVGVELDEPEGKNDGSVGGVRYFICPPKLGNNSSERHDHGGGFISMQRELKEKECWTSAAKMLNISFKRWQRPKTDQKDTAKEPKTELEDKSSVASLDPEGLNVEVGDQVLVAGQKNGIVRFYGKTDFAPGFWFGIELDQPTGKHDGSVFGVRYFSCLPKYGVFAPPSLRIYSVRFRDVSMMILK
uniref:CAP-Gly domain-containing protein n=1 Tax=Amphiprion percula TaxID=161767 RepID=A0A3P8TVY8_AMPPE